MASKRTPQRVILLTGKMRSGKDTAALYLHDRYLFTRRKFAAPLYDMVCALYKDVVNDISYSYIEARKAEKAPLTMLAWREVLQTLGTEWGRRRISTNIWTDLAKEVVVAAYPASVVISDCRFINEWTAFRDDRRFDAKLVGITRLIDPLDAVAIDHESEQQIEQLHTMADAMLTNTSIRADLYDQIDVTLECFEW